MSLSLLLLTVVKTERVVLYTVRLLPYFLSYSSQPTAEIIAG